MRNCGVIIGVCTREYLSHTFINQMLILARSDVIIVNKYFAQMHKFGMNGKRRNAVIGGHSSIN